MSLRKQATSGFVWTFAQQFGNQASSFLVSLVLARLLLPEEFGLIGMIAIFVSVGNVLLNSGLTQSLIRSKKLNDDDYSTVFYFNLLASIVIYLIIYISGPYIANFYDQPILKDIVRLYCVTFIISAFSAVQSARLTKSMNFKTQTIIAVPATVVGGIVGISMAYMGFGVWSLVWSQIASSLLSSIQLWIYSKWVPARVFKVDKFRNHFNFGYKITISSLLNRVFDNAYLIIIGKFFSPAQVGFYTRAETMKQLPVTNISNALNKVTYPLFASIQDDDVRLKRVYKQLMQMVVYIITPVLIFLAVLAEPTFRFLFTSKWLPAVPYFQILCATGILYPIHAYNLNVLKVKGRSDLFLKLAFYKKAITLMGIVIGIQFGIYGLLYAQVILSFIAFYINAYYTDRFINYSAWEQIKDISPIITLSIFCGFLLFLVDFYLQAYDMIDFIRLAIGGLAGVFLYLSISFFLKFESLNKLRNILKF
ncbi:lipopolysaccharide biosynthesis protein [Christiangramia echinicola]|uniref:Membrane protein involved in the export of O-antigen and teichoic acid n=1 Tax=Christiangramia echinicola TaxID=279359 RepID=A0A1H1QNX4_9FLAO|nr:lipopolysaccharide biosynthesis protein [Christiangramia echinicola]SDS25033.1 Membrane protein involved in the export of O-antigen and teichoic acid [Christiangramia echinicola]